MPSYQKNRRKLLRIFRKNAVSYKPGACPNSAAKHQTVFQGQLAQRRYHWLNHHLLHQLHPKLLEKVIKADKFQDTFQTFFPLRNSPTLSSTSLC